MIYEKKLTVNIEGTERTLYITDDVQRAGQLKEAGEAVLIYLHMGNREQDMSGFPYAVEEPEELDGEYAERAYRRLKGLPWRILETDRCLVRETTVEDVDAFYRIYSAPEITRYMEELYPEPEQERQYVREYIEKVYGFYEFGVWTVVEKAGGEVIGRAGFSYREGFDIPELGFIIGVPWQRKGYAGEVCRAILKYGRENLGFRQIQAVVEPRNEISLRLCGSLGFYIREEILLEGRRYIRLQTD